MRKRAAKKRPLLPDPRFNDQLVTRFVNNLMWDGKKSVAFKVFYDAIDIVEEKKTDEEKTGVEIFGRSDATLNPGGIRIGTAEIYQSISSIVYIKDSVVVGQNKNNDERIILFVKLKNITIVFKCNRGETEGQFSLLFPLFQYQQVCPHQQEETHF